MASTHKTAKVNYPNLDLMKFFLALLVVEIHTRPLKCFYFAETVIEGIDVLAVPFFFLASGFLCFRDLNYASFGVAISAGTERVRNTIIKLVRLYLIWTLLYLPLTIFGNVLLGKTFFMVLYPSSGELCSLGRIIIRGLYGICWRASLVSLLSLFAFIGDGGLST